MTASEIVFSSWWTLGVVLATVNATLFAVSIYRVSGKLAVSAWIGVCVLSAVIIASVILASFQSTGSVDTDIAAQFMCLIALVALGWLWIKRRSV